MAYEKEDQSDENEFVHFEEEELGGDPEEVIEEETEEELVITERPGGRGCCASPSRVETCGQEKSPGQEGQKTSRQENEKEGRS